MSSGEEDVHIGHYELDGMQYRPILKNIYRQRSRLMIFYTIWTLVSTGLVLFGVFQEQDKFLSWFEYTLLGINVIGFCSTIYFKFKWGTLKRDGFPLVVYARFVTLQGIVAWVLLFAVLVLILYFHGIQSFEWKVLPVTFFLALPSLVILPIPLRQIMISTSILDLNLSEAFLQEYQHSNRPRFNHYRMKSHSPVAEAAIVPGQSKISSSTFDMELEPEFSIQVPAEVYPLAITPPADEVSHAVFALDTTTKAQFQRVWNELPPAGSVSIHFTDSPTLTEITRHLESNGFTILSSKQLQGQKVWEIQFGATQRGHPEIVFVAEIMVLLERQVVQSAFKCSSRDQTMDFLAHFQLQHVFVEKAPSTK